MKMNNKGFTLIELLAVIAILSGISLIAVFGISSSLERRDAKECLEQIQLAKNAAKIYFSLENTNEVTIDELKRDNYFNEKSKNDKLLDSDKIVLENNGYVYYGTGECKEIIE